MKILMYVTDFMIPAIIILVVIYGLLEKVLVKLPISVGFFGFSLLLPVLT